MDRPVWWTYQHLGVNVPRRLGEGRHLVTSTSREEDRCVALWPHWNGRGSICEAAEVKLWCGKV